MSDSKVVKIENREPHRSLKHLPKKYEAKFSDGIPLRPTISVCDIVYPEELLDKKCGGCHRCELRDHGDKGGYHCCMQAWDIDITPDDKACVHYWDREEQEKLDRLHQEDIEKRREELWAIYAERKSTE